MFGSQELTWEGYFQRKYHETEIRSIDMWVVTETIVLQMSDRSLWNEISVKIEGTLL